MSDLIKSLSARAEFFVVIGMSFGYFILASVMYAFFVDSPAKISDSNLSGLLIFEPLILIAVLAFLYHRDWRLSQFNMMPSLGATLQGFLIAIGAYFIFAIMFWIAGSLSDNVRGMIANRDLVESQLSLANIIGVSIVNPIYEELLVVGYIVLRLKNDRSVWFAINTSVAIRLLYHLYQGPVAVFSVIPAGLIFAFWYARTNKLWPIIVAHAIIDFVGLYASGNAA